MLIGLAVGILFGMLQGYIIAYLRVPAFIVTLGGMWVFKGLLLIVTEGKTIPANQPVFSQIAQGYLPPLVGWILARRDCGFSDLQHVQQPPEETPIWL